MYLKTVETHAGRETPAGCGAYMENEKWNLKDVKSSLSDLSGQGLFVFLCESHNSHMRCAFTNLGLAQIEIANRKICGVETRQFQKKLSCVSPKKFSRSHEVASRAI